jgi:DNA-binding NtrC family response regulator
MDSDRDPTPETVLLFEQESLTRAGVSRFLSEAGFQVTEACTPNDAWAMLESLPSVGVLVADLDAPDGADNLELARKVHERWPSVGLVIISGHVRHLRPSEIPGNGCFLPRPLPAETLLHEVKMAVHQIAT